MHITPRTSVEHILKPRETCWGVRSEEDFDRLNILIRSIEASHTHGWLAVQSDLMQFDSVSRVVWASQLIPEGARVQ